MTWEILSGTVVPNCAQLVRRPLFHHSRTPREATMRPCPNLRPGCLLHLPALLVAGASFAWLVWQIEAAKCRDVVVAPEANPVPA